MGDFKQSMLELEKEFEQVLMDLNTAAVDVVLGDDEEDEKTKAVEKGRSMKQKLNDLIGSYLSNPIPEDQELFSMLLMSYVPRIDTAIDSLLRAKEQPIEMIVEDEKGTFDLFNEMQEAISKLKELEKVSVPSSELKLSEEVFEQRWKAPPEPELKPLFAQDDSGSEEEANSEIKDSDSAEHEEPKGTEE